MARTAFYVDGFNLYHAIKELGLPHLKWLNLKELARTFLQPGDSLEKVCYFTAVQSHPPVKASRHRRYIDALRAVGVEVVNSNFQRVQKYCKDNDRHCRFQEEKRTDVALATRYVVDSIKGIAERVIVVTADSDQIPAIEAVQVFAPQVRLQLAIPPGRRGHAMELARCFTEPPVELKPPRMNACLLPRTVEKDGRSIATCPTEWLPQDI